MLSLSKIPKSPRLLPSLQTPPPLSTLHSTIFTTANPSFGRYNDLKGRNSDTSTAELGSDVDDSCSPTRQSSSRFPRLAPDMKKARHQIPLPTTAAMKILARLIKLVILTKEWDIVLINHLDPMIEEIRPVWQNSVHKGSFISIYNLIQSNELGISSLGGSNS
ncbi:hypothetical protein Vadar_020408 [Vaccinium darrowii]|uniref:Uncharacterized protein n=1 Tax=Vaccinium darrowii TaxID=229202 RepID=A0ACB7Z538_9ERIC|nr:hypothetical protein Vadar_020408 [Vaccinium darrowii]